MRSRLHGNDRSGAGPLARRARIGLIGLALLAAGPAASHQIDHRVTRAEAVVVTLTEGADHPLSDAEYRVYAPEPGEPFASGRTDANGTLSFRPDRPGDWRVLVSDAGGHGASLTIEVDEALESIGRSGNGGGGGRVSMLIAGIGYIAGLAALLVFWLGRR